MRLATAVPRPKMTGLIPRLFMLALATGVLVLTFLAWGVWRTQPPAPAASSTVPAASSATAITAQGLEDRWGVHVYLLAITAHGGFIDFRLLVTDPAKAARIFEDDKNLPLLIVERTGTVLKSALQKSATLQFETGRAYGSLYPNSRGELKTGDMVSVVIGDLKLEHQPLQ
jgi:hypothetical protein